MIKRLWHGWTTPENADAYENLLEAEVFPGIEAKNIRGYRGIELLRREHGDEVEFMTVMTFDSLAAVIAFQGKDYEKCYVPDAARRLLARWDQTSQHYEIQANRLYDPAGKARCGDES